MKKVKLFYIPYLLGMVVFSMLTADSDIVNIFKGAKIILWILVLLIFYSLLVIITNIVMKFIGSIFIKLADPKKFDVNNAKDQVLTFMLPIFYAHLVCIYFNQYIGDSFLIILIYILPMLYITVNSKYKKLHKKIIAMLPFVVYIILDIITIIGKIEV